MSQPPPKAPPFFAPTEPREFRNPSNAAALSRLHPHLPSRAWATCAPRQTSNPTVRSPLQQSFPAYPGPASAPNSPPMQETPSRRSRQSEQDGRKRGESRSSSVPIIVHVSEEEGQRESNNHLDSRTQPPSRAGSPFTHVRANDINTLNQTRRSVKHLTCFWWWEKGECRFSDEECLYSHHDTGHYTNAPRQVIPGEPAKAGKTLERALNKLGFPNRSTASLSSLANSNVSAHRATSVTASRPDTPFVDRGRRPNRSRTPSPLEIGRATQLKADNDFLRSLVEQTQREKQALIDALEALQIDKTVMRSQFEAMSMEYGHLLTEREALQATVKKLQLSATKMPARSPSLVPSPSPWGAIGSRRTSPAEATQPRAISRGGGATGSTSTAQSIPVPAFNASLAFDFAAAAPYCHPDTSFDDDLSPLGSMNEGDKLKSVLRSLGPSF